MWKRKKKRHEAPYSVHFHSASAFAAIVETFVDCPSTYLMIGSNSRSYFRMVAPDGGPDVWRESPTGCASSSFACFEIRDMLSVSSHLEFIESTDKSHSLLLEYTANRIQCRVESNRDVVYAFDIPFVRTVSTFEIDRACAVPTPDRIVKIPSKEYARSVRFIVQSSETRDVKLKCVDDVCLYTPNSKVSIPSVKALPKQWDDPETTFELDMKRLELSERVRLFSTVDCLVCFSQGSVRIECKINTRHRKSDDLHIAFPLLPPLHNPTEE